MQRSSSIPRSFGLRLVVAAAATATLALVAFTESAEAQQLPPDSCPRCTREFADKLSVCMDDFEKCRAPCPDCPSGAGCEASKTCMAPCLKKQSRCKADARKDRDECRRGC